MYFSYTPLPPTPPPLIKWIKVNEQTFAKFAKDISIVLFLLPQEFQQL